MSLQAKEPAPADSAHRDALVAAIMTFIGGDGLLTRDEIRSALEREVDGAGAAALVSMRERLSSVRADWDYSPPDPLARRIHHLLAGKLMQPDSTLVGVEHAEAVANAPVVIVANHLSYADANIVEILLQRAGAGALADRLTTMAGPKVYVNRERHFSSLCFGTIRTPQNTGVSSDEAVMSPGEVARAARRVIEVAHERLALGEALLVFGEGTRSRTAAMQPMLPGVARYLDRAETWMLPVGITGTEAVFPVQDNRLHAGRIVVRLGAPVKGGTLCACARGVRRLVMDAVGIAISELLPPSYQGVYDQRRDDLADARRVLFEARMFGDTQR
jgi:1-acyl-sn-glycerol-3-phosphate acyltransferase